MKYINKFEDCKDFKLNEVRVIKEKGKENYKKQSCIYIKYKKNIGSLCSIEKKDKQCKYSLQEKHNVKK